MTDFIIKRSELPDTPTLLIRYAPTFAESSEFQMLNEWERTVPGLVCAAFGKRLVQLHGQIPSSSPELEQYYLAIERLATSNDPAMQNLVVVEIFENIPSRLMFTEVKPHLKPKSLALFERWIA